MNSIWCNISLPETLYVFKVHPFQMNVVKDSGGYKMVATVYSGVIGDPIWRGVSLDRFATVAACDYLRRIFAQIRQAPYINRDANWVTTQPVSRGASKSYFLGLREDITMVAQQEEGQTRVLFYYSGNFYLEKNYPGVAVENIISEHLYFNIYQECHEDLLSRLAVAIGKLREPK